MSLSSTEGGTSSVFDSIAKPVPAASTVGAVVKIDEMGRTIVAPFRKYRDAHRMHYSFDSELTFSPKLNQTSLKMARERGDRWKEAYGLRQAAQAAETEKLFTFRPRVSEKSRKIVQKLKTTFKSRNIRRQRDDDDNKTKKKNSKARASKSSASAACLPSLVPHAQDDSPSSSPEKCQSSCSNLPEIKSEASLTPIQVQTAPPRKLATAATATAPNVVKAPSPSPSPPPPRLSASVPQETTVISPKCRRSKVTATTRSLSSSAAAAVVSPQWCDVPPIGRVRRARHAAERAVVEKKVFLCLGPYPAVRQSLRRRGWVEKNYHGPLGDGQRAMKKKTKKIVRNAAGEKEATSTTAAAAAAASESDASSSDSDGEPEDSDLLVQAYREEFRSSEDDQYSMASRAVRDSYPHFIWTCKPRDVAFRLLRKDQIACHYKRNGSLTTKVGICMHLRNLRWYGDVHADTFFPRCYRLCADDEKFNFIDDFRLTAASNILKWITDDYQNCRRRNSGSNGPVIPRSAIKLALKACENFITSCEHRDIDERGTKSVLTEEEWNSLVLFSHQLTVEKGTLEPHAGKNDVSRFENVLSQLRLYLPQFDMDGMTNIWIVKPGAKSRGRGITCINKLETILALASSPAQKDESKWVVQKYIERPLLIYNTKFDIRQWFLVTAWNPLTFWMYKDCYLRFCSQQFSLDNLDVSVHLCNNSIQKYYENVARSEELPDDNLWFHERFKEFLAERGAETAWDETIYPGMKQAIANVLLTTQEDMETRKNSFELYGADFMITEGDYRPWLIEVNCSPAMGASGKVTAKLCPQVIEDTIKVVIDRKVNKTVDTGRFELALKQPAVAVPPYTGMQLSVDGTRISKSSRPRAVSLERFGDETTATSLAALNSVDNDIATTDRSLKSPSPSCAVPSKRFSFAMQALSTENRQECRSVARTGSLRQSLPKTSKIKLSVTDLAVFGAGRTRKDV